VVEPVALHHEDNWNKGKEDYVDGEEGHGDAPEELIVLLRVFEFDDVHPPRGLNVLPNMAVPQHEHGDQEAKEQHLGDERSHDDVHLSLVVVE